MKCWKSTSLFYSRQPTRGGLGHWNRTGLVRLVNTQKKKKNQEKEKGIPTFKRPESIERKRGERERGRIEEREDGDPFRSAGEQARANAARSILWIPDPAGEKGSRGRNRPKMPHSYRKPGTLLLILHPSFLSFFFFINYSLSYSSDYYR